MERVWFGLGSAFALLGVAAGALAAHLLRDRLSSDALAIFESAARYQVYHALALLAVSFALSRWGGGMINLAGWSFVAGILLFSGSLYLLALTNVRVLGAITPLGGACFLLGWVILLFRTLRG